MLPTVALLFALGLDTFAVALGLGMKGLPRAQWLRVGLTFALFEGVMPALGLLTGRGVSGALGHATSFAAGAILAGLGAWELREAFEDDDRPAPAPVKHHASFLLGLSVSLDEFAVGFSLGVLRIPIGLVLAYVAVQAFAITFLGLAIGARVGRRLQERAELLAGSLFIILGVGIIIATWTGREFL